MKKIILCANSSWYLFNFRKSSIKALINKGYEVYSVAPRDHATEKLKEISSKHISFQFNKSSINPLKEFYYITALFRIFKDIKPDAVFNFTIKNNLYGSIVGFLLRLKVINNITGLGSVMLRPSLIKLVIVILYKIIKKIPHHTFCQNLDDLNYLVKKRLVIKSKVSLIPGSGLDTNFFSPNINNIDDNSFTFLFVGRIIKDKGFFELIEAFKKISVDCPNIKLMILGEIDSKNPSRVNASYIKELSLHPNINIYGHENDVRPFLSKASCFVLPSYREGLSRSILEAMSMELPIITTDVPGCRELVQDKKSGIICKPRSSESLKRAMLKMINLDDDARMRMGKVGRKIVQSGYDEKFVIDAMLKVI